ncbi:MAG: ornithine cyclodeaminase family protein [Geminicoccaceae bacterium]
MRIVTKDEILTHLDMKVALTAVEDGFRAFASDKVQVAQTVHLAFPDARGECHVKSAHIKGETVFTVKVATGFYNNPSQGQSSSNGFMAVISARTGAPVAILQDEGVLTDVRTALAGVIAARIGAKAGAQVLGIIGSGIQARLQAEMIASLLGYAHILVWARCAYKADAVVQDLRRKLPSVSIETTDSAERIARQADTIVTTTSSESPLLRSSWVAPGSHIVAVGADSPGKQELDTNLFKRARHVIVDSLPQCVEHGETANAIAAGAIATDRLKTLGELLGGPGLARDDEDITIADLTGVALQDAAIAGCVWQQLKESTAAKVRALHIVDTQDYTK